MMSKRGSSEPESGKPKEAKRYGLTGLKIRPDDGASVVVGRGATTCSRNAGKPHTGPRDADFQVVKKKRGAHSATSKRHPYNTEQYDAWDRRENHRRSRTEAYSGSYCRLESFKVQTHPCPSCLHPQTQW